MKVTTAKAEQTAIPELGKEAKTLYYLILGEFHEQLIINVGEKTFNGVKALLTNETTKKESDTNKDNKPSTRKTA